MQTSKSQLSNLDSPNPDHPPHATNEYPTPASTPASEGSHQLSDASDDNHSDSSGETLLTAQLLPPRIMSESRGAMPSTSILSTFPKLGTCDIHHWRKNIEGYIKACGLGSFIRSSVQAPADLDELDKFEMRQQQVMLAIRATIDAVHMQHIAGMDDPYLVIQSLEKRHGVNSGLAAANIITKIVNHRYDSSMKLEDYVSSAQSLHNQLAETASADSGLKLSDQVLALLMLINLPRDDYNGIIQQMMGDVKNLSTSNVINRLLTEAQMNASEPSSSVAYNAISKSRKPEKKSATGKGGDCSSNAPDALCSHPGHQFSMHSNRDCKAKNQDGSQSSSRPLNRQWSAPVSHINSKPTQLSDADKIRLFDQAFSSRAATSKTSASANAALAVDESSDAGEDEVINLTTAYAAIVSSQAEQDDYFMDTGSNKDIFKNAKVFKNLRNIRPVTIKSANGGVMVAKQVGDVEMKTYDFENTEYRTQFHDVLYCAEVAVNLISATKLCDLGFVLSGDSSSMSFTHANGDKIFAYCNPHSMDLWKARVSTDSTTPSTHAPSNGIHTSRAYNADADLTHQRMAHLHSSALRRFCNDGGRMTDKCTSCIMAKSTRKSFTSHLPTSNRMLYRVHSDVVGPIQSATSNGKRYFVTFIDEASRYNKIFLISHKSQVFESFRTYMAEAERHTGEKLCILKSDRGGEYRSSRFLAFAAVNGIIMEQGPAKTPQHNSVAERFNQTIMEKTRAQMIHANLPAHLWGEVVMATSHILNVTPSSVIKDSPVNR